MLYGCLARLRLIHLACARDTSSQVRCHINKDYTSYSEYLSGYLLPVERGIGPEQ